MGGVGVRPPSPVVQRALGHQQEQWQEKLCVEIAAEMPDWATFFDKHRKGDAHVLFSAFVADYADPGHCLRGIPSGRRTWWRNGVYDPLVEEAPFMPVGYGRQHLLAKPWLSKFPTPAIKYLFWKDVIMKPH